MMEQETLQGDNALSIASALSEELSSNGALAKAIAQHIAPLLARSIVSDEALAQELAIQLLPLLQGKVATKKWVKANEAAELLGYPSVRALGEARRNGLLRIGIECKRPPGSRAWLYNVQAIQKRKD